MYWKDHFCVICSSRHGSSICYKDAKYPTYGSNQGTKMQFRSYICVVFVLSLLILFLHLALFYALTAYSVQTIERQSQRREGGHDVM